MKKKYDAFIQEFKNALICSNPQGDSVPKILTVNYAGYTITFTQFEFHEKYSEFVNIKIKNLEGKAEKAEGNISYSTYQDVCKSLLFRHNNKLPPTSSPLTDEGKINLRDVNLSGAKLARSDLANVDLSGANLREADLSHADLSGSLLLGTNLNKAKMIGAKLEKALCSYAELFKADLSQASLTKTDFSKSRLTEANLTGVKSDEANFFAANLNQANLSSALLSGANLQGADISSANFTAANLKDAKLAKTKRLYAIWEGTVLSGTLLDKKPIPEYKITRS